MDDAADGAHDDGDSDGERNVRAANASVAMLMMVVKVMTTGKIQTWMIVIMMMKMKNMKTKIKDVGTLKWNLNMRLDLRRRFCLIACMEADDI
jgi:hypothetical protein